MKYIKITFGILFYGIGVSVLFRIGWLDSFEWIVVWDLVSALVSVGFGLYLLEVEHELN